MSFTILTVASGRMDATHASFLNFIKMSDGFAKLGHRVTAVMDQSRSSHFRENDLRERYSLSKNLSCVTFRQGSSRHRRLVWHSVRQALKIRPDFAYCRAQVPPFFLSLLNIPCAAELHGIRGKGFDSVYWLSAASRLPSFRCLSTIAPELKEQYASLGIKKDKILVQPDAVDVDLFGNVDASQVPFEGAGPHLLYAGHLYDYKGIPILLECAKRLPDCTFHLVGGHDSDIQRIRDIITNEKMKNVILHGYIEYSILPKYIRSADVLLHPYSAKHPSSSTTSPMKLGEYMLSSKPVVATDIQGLRNWVSDDDVLFVEPDNPEAFTQGIRKVLHLQSDVENRTRNARGLALCWSFSERARKILEFSGVRCANTAA